MAPFGTRLPVLGVPVESKVLKGMVILLSIVQMPAGIPVGTLAIGKAGAVNAAPLAAAMLATSDEALAARLEAWRQAQPDLVALQPERAARCSTPAPPSAPSAAGRSAACRASPRPPSAPAPPSLCPRPPTPPPLSLPQLAHAVGTN